MRVEEGRVRGAHHDVAVRDPVERASGAHAVHGGDHRLPDFVPAWAQVSARVLMLRPRLGPVEERTVRIEAFGDVDTGAEGTIPGRGQDDGADGVVGADL